MEMFKSLASPNGRYRATVQSDGNFVVYDSVGTPIWSSVTFRYPGASVVLQDDGDLVVRSGQTVVWNTDTATAGGGSRLFMQNDGNLVLYNARNRPMWSSVYGLASPPSIAAPISVGAGFSLLSDDGNYRAIFQSDGNLVVYNGVGAPTWGAGTFGYPGSSLRLFADGNVLIYSADNTVLWQTSTAQSGGTNRLIMQSDGNLVLYTSTGKPVWNSLGFPV
jgi:hypothetical protein